MPGTQARPIRTLQKFNGQIICGIGREKGPTPGGYQETAVIPDGPDVLGVGVVLDGIGGHGWRRVCRVRWFDCWFMGNGDSVLLRASVICNRLNLQVNYQFAHPQVVPAGQLSPQL